MAFFSIGTSPAEVRIISNTMCTPADGIRMAAEIMGVPSNTMSTTAQVIHRATEEVHMATGVVRIRKKTHWRLRAHFCPEGKG